MAQRYESRVSVADLETKQPHELLLWLAAGLTILISVVLFATGWTPTIGQAALTTLVTTLVINVVLGAALWVSAAIVKKNLWNGAIFAAVVSIVLLWYGGFAGALGGLVGLLGAVLAAVSPFMPTMLPAKAR